MMKNFIGLDGFIWWVGVIENRMDPLGLGRCKVRIYGWHTNDTSGTDPAKIAIPVDDLPWALPLLPLNSRNSFFPPELGDWVMGFFMDGESGQFPVMMGILPAFAQPPETSA